MTLHKRLFIWFWASFICCVPPLAGAGANPMIVEQPQRVHRFFDAKNILAQSMNVAFLAADVVSTERALQVPGTHEANPLAQSQASLLVLKAAGVGAGWGLAYAMHRSGHHRAERIIPMVFGLPSAVAALHNAGVR